MIKLEKFTGTKTYMYPNGAIATPERMRADFPALDVFPHVIETDHRGQVCFAVTQLGALEDRYGVAEELTDDESISLLQELMNAPQPEPAPSAEERIASAMEYQNLFI